MTNAPKDAGVFREKLKHCHRLIFGGRNIWRLTEDQPERIGGNVDAVSEAVHPFSIAAIACPDFNDARPMPGADNLNVRRGIAHPKRLTAGSSNLADSKYIGW